MNREFNFAEEVANRICSENKQHATAIAIGRTGSGKSYAMMKVCEDLSRFVADRVGGDPQDYFNIDHMAVISLDEVKRVVHLFDQKHGIFILDDIGVGYNARKFSSEGNQIMNDILQTFRPNENFLGMTVPSQENIDKVGRNLQHYFIEMQNPLYKYGLSVAKVFRVVRDTRNNKTLYKYLVDKDGCKVVRILFPLPSNELCSAYDKKRNEQYKIMSEQRMERWEELERGKNISKSTTAKEAVSRWKWEKHQGKHENQTLKDFCEKNGFNYITAKQY